MRSALPRPSPPGLWCCVHDGAQSKRMHAGHAAWGGLMSAVLARRGFTGPTHVFEEVWGGFNHSFAPTSSDPDAYLRELGENWKLGASPSSRTPPAAPPMPQSTPSTTCAPHTASRPMTSRRCT